jgi:tetratricopeptide (TPR) repeat protein
MQRPWNHSVCRLLACLLALLILSATAEAEWFKDYEAAMDLVKKGQWDAAVPKLRSAIGQKNEEGSNIKFYGMKFGDYFPHYYLGLAYFNQKDYEAALQEFQQSEALGAIQRKSDLYGKLNNTKTLALAQIAVIKAREAPANPPIAQTPPPISNPVVTTPPARPPVEEKKIAELPKVTPPELKKTVPEPTPAQPAAPPIDLTAEGAKLMVKEGARKYFEGDYDAAINLFATAVEVNSKDLVAQFLLGCSYASKYLVSGSQNSELYNSALAAFYKVRRLRPSYQPKETGFFSPAVLNIYSKTG